jgi:flavin-dependent dehydrogenase
MLIGDAAGLAYPQSGEGIYTAVKSGLLAAETIFEANNDYRMAALQNYATRLNTFFGDDTMLANISLPNALRTMAAQLLFKNHYFSRHILLDKWFLHRRANVP